MTVITRSPTTRAVPGLAVSVLVVHDTSVVVDPSDTELGHTIGRAESRQP
jgi:hypothetical protein